ncbi:hypothetical protein ACFC0D_13270 [Streptomyces sp. NPDC056222]|uniref:hypothetical protein n=1 Tax=Streptomyces sp. NPDC056222 TaxID=3345749 RepID=UPI0035DA7D81
MTDNRVDPTRPHELSDPPEWQRRLETAGLVVMGRAVPDGFPEVMSAVYAVNGIEVQPSDSISDSLVDAAAELDRRWDARAAAVRLVSAAGEFYILAPGPGGHEVGWIHVADTVGRALPSRIAAATGSRSFIALSLDGTSLCAVSVEEYDLWIVTHSFDGVQSEGR